MSPCLDAMIKKPITIHPKITVKQALEVFEINNIRSLPVVDDAGKLVGLFGLRHVLLKLLPASVAMEDGVQRLDFLIGAGPGIAKRLKKLYPTKVEDVMDKNPIVLDQETATYEAVRVMALHGSPLVIIDENNGDFVGMISRQSLLRDLHQMVEDLDLENQNS